MIQATGFLWHFHVCLQRAWIFHNSLYPNLLHFLPFPTPESPGTLLLSCSFQVFLDMHTWQKTQESYLCQINVFLLTKAFSSTCFWMFCYDLKLNMLRHTCPLEHVTMILFPSELMCFLCWGDSALGLRNSVINGWSTKPLSLCGWYFPASCSLTQGAHDIGWIVCHSTECLMAFTSFPKTDGARKH